MIHEAGLERFYEQRLGIAPRRGEGSDENWEVYDRPAVQAGWVQVHDDGSREALLTLDGMVCGACAWLNERNLLRLPGVLSAQVNFAGQRLRVRWRASEQRLSDILAAVGALGYRAAPYQAESEGEREKAARRGYQWRLGIAALGMMQVMMYAFPAYLTQDEMSAHAQGLLRWAGMILTLPVLFFSAGPFWMGAWRDLRHRRVGMDVPVALALGVGFGASAWATLRGQGEVYFDAVTMFVFLLLAARFYEYSARQRAGASLRFAARPLPAICSRVVEGEGMLRVERVAVAELAAGEAVLAAPGDVIPADGRVEDGISRVEEAQLSGEFWPVLKKPGDLVFAGSVNRQEALRLRVTAVGAATRLWAIGHLADRALASRPRLAQIADAIAARFVLVQLALAATAGIVWLALDPSRALTIVVAVLVVSCPCALSLAAPMALAVAAGALARRGLLVTGARALESLARATDVVLDKTGTLSTGQMVVRSVQALGHINPVAVLDITASLESGSRHPLALALQRPGAPLAEDWREIPGAGVSGKVSGLDYRLGRVEWVAEIAGPVPPDARFATVPGASVIALASAGMWHAVIMLDDAPRAEAAAAIEELRALGLGLHLLSGDEPVTVAAWAQGLGIAQARGGANPEDKLGYLQRLQAHGRVVAMVGDGVNDAPALAQADVAIALGSGAALARQTADVVLLGERLLPLAHSIATARRCLAVLRQNLAWAFAYNVLAIPLATLGRIEPWMAALGMAVSSLLVVANAGRLAGDPQAWKSSRS